MLWWCKVGEDVANVLNGPYFFWIVVSEESVGRYSLDAPIHVFFMFFFQSLVMQCILLFLCQTSMSIVLFCCLLTSTIWHAFINVLGKLVESKNATTVKSQCFDDNSKVLMHALTTHLNLLNGNWELGTKLIFLTLPSKQKHFFKPSILIGLFCLLAFI